MTTAIDTDTHAQTPEHTPGMPNWQARRWLAALGISVCAVALTLSGHHRVQLHEQKQETLQLLAEAEAAAQEFEQWQLAQSGEDGSLQADDGLFDTAPAVRLASADISDLVSYDFTELEIARIQSAERRCLADAIYFESRNESMLGKLGVADVVLNRVKSAYYPDTICGVVYQGSERTTGCQFSFTCDGSMEKRLNVRLYEDIDELAGVILAGMHMPVSRNATHYHADYVSPYWAPTLTPTAQIGAHKFYRFPNKTSETIVSAAQ